MSAVLENKSSPKPTWKQTISWALYDWANTGYAMVVLALVMPQLYKSYYGAELTDDRQTFMFGMTVSIASLLVAVLAPFLGSIGELGGLRKRLLLTFAAIGVVATAGFYFVQEGQYMIATMIYIVGTVSFYSSNIFFDSMLATVSTPERRHTVSGLGFSFGYAAGLVLLIAVGIITGAPEKFGLANAVEASQVMFLVAAVWWALFSIPLAINLKERPRPDRPPLLIMMGLGAKDTWMTFKEILKIKPMLWFLVAYLFYIDGVNTIITNAVNYGTTIGFDIGQIMKAFLVVQIFGVPCAIIFGWLGAKFGPRKMMFVAIMLYLCVTTYGAFLETTPVHFLGFEVSQMFVLGALIGTVQGGIQALSRSYFNTLIPPGREVSFFGFYSMIGKSAAVMGPALMGTMALIFNDPENPTLSTRIGMGSVASLFVIGAVFLALAGHFDKKDTSIGADRE
ncbi:MAG: MFS transporter [Puniceicoccales bacterium]